MSHHLTRPGQYQKIWIEPKSNYHDETKFNQVWACPNPWPTLYINLILFELSQDIVVRTGFDADPYFILNIAIIKKHLLLINNKFYDDAKTI